MDKKMNKLKYGSIIPDLKYRLGKNPAKNITDHIHPKVVFFNRDPILKSILKNCVAYLSKLTNFSSNRVDPLTSEIVS